VPAEMRKKTQASNKCNEHLLLHFKRDLTALSVPKMTQHPCQMNQYGTFVEWYCHGKTEILGKKPLSLCYSVHHKSHMDWLVTELWPRRPEAGDRDSIGKKSRSGRNLSRITLRACTTQPVTLPTKSMRLIKSTQANMQLWHTRERASSELL
jgi:hypothetical protein